MEEIEDFCGEDCRKICVQKGKSDYYYQTSDIGVL